MIPGKGLLFFERKYIIKAVFLGKCCEPIQFVKNQRTINLLRKEGIQDESKNFNH